MIILEYQIEKMDSYIKNLIDAGENQGLDFKFEINDTIYYSLKKIPPQPKGTV